MGNSNSQQLQLDPEKYFLHRDRTWSHHQGHLIVPLTDAVIQRKMLRNTENGVILQNEGTISQRRRSMRHPDEGMFALSPSRRTLSDSDLSRAPFDHVMAPNMDSFTQKSVIAVSPSKAKIKLRKNKGKAPEPPGPPLDPRDVQRRFVRSNSSLCPRTWENEFNSLNLDRQPRCDSRNRQQIPPKSRHSRPESNLSRRPEKVANGSQKSISSLNSHRSSPRSAPAPVNMKRLPNKANPVEASKPPRKAVSDTPKPSPVKPQFYFSNMDALKKETPKPTTNAPPHQNPTAKPASPVTKPAPVKATPAPVTTVQPLINKAPLSRVEGSKPTPRPLKVDARQCAPSVGRDGPKPAGPKDPLPSRTGVPGHKVIPPPPVTKKLPDVPLKIESLPNRETNKTAVRPGPALNVTHNNNKNESNVAIRPTMQNDNIVFKVNPNFIVPPQCTLPQTATQILDELDATLENYSQISAERKSDDSDYCEPDEREIHSRASSNTQTAVVRETGIFAPQIPPPKSLEMLFRPPSPRVLPPPPTRFNGLDIMSQIEMTSLPLADQPPTPPPIPSSWMKTRKNSVSSEENEAANEINISVHLRPCLPRRPLLLASMPSRFSPTHAWKSLDPAGSDGDHHDDKSLSDCELSFSSSSSSSDEDRKEENTLKAHLSVDSGITGGYSHPNPQWTPKEDLIDTDSESTGGGHDLGLCSLPSQARFTLPSMFLQNSAGVDSNWSFKSGPHSLQQKSQSFVYLPPPKSSENTVHIIGQTNSHRSSTGGRNPSLSMGVSLNIETHDPLLEAERLREKEHKWMQKVEEEFRKRRERDRQELQEQMQLFNSLTANIRPDPEGGCDQLQVR